MGHEPDIIDMVMNMSMIEMPVVKIRRLEIENFKNVKKGTITMPSALKADVAGYGDILGIYGQNGSGKTAIVDALDTIKTLLCGMALPDDMRNLIMYGENMCRISVEFEIATESIEKFNASYTAEISRAAPEAKQGDDKQSRDVEVSREVLKMPCGAAGRMAKYIEYTSDESKPVFAPDNRRKSIIQSMAGDNPEGEINAALELKLIRALAKQNGESFIFGNRTTRKVLDHFDGDIGPYAITSLKLFAMVNMTVIDGITSLFSSSNMLFRVPIRDKGGIVSKTIKIYEPTVVNMDEYEQMEGPMKNLNVVLGALIPGLQIAVHDLGKETMADGKEGHRIELMSQRQMSNDKIAEVPLKYESNGIVKIASLLSEIVAVCSDPVACLIVDEFDASINEYLLGELLSAMSSAAKGQLIFTAHNLRPLEMLDYRSVIFSTSNANDRYKRLSKKPNNNLRSMYIREAAIGGEGDELYSDADSIKIGRALRKAGKGMRDAGK